MTAPTTARRRWPYRAALLALVLGAALWLRGGSTEPADAPVAAPTSTAGPAVVSAAERFAQVEAARRALDPTLPALTLTGRVLDEDDAPVEGARVVLAAPARETRTDADGGFSFAGLAAGSYVLEAFAGDDYGGPINAHLAPAETHALIRLYPGGRLRVRVVSAVDERPLADATVGVRMNSMFDGALDLRAVTGADGFASFAALPSSGVEVWAIADRHELAMGPLNTSLFEGRDWSYTLRLAPGQPVTGRVVDERGAPVAGATIEVAPAPMPGLAGAVRAVVSDPEGAFALPGVRPGAWHVHALHDDFDLGIAPVEVPAHGAPPPVTVTLPAGIAVSGVVATASLEPVPGAAVEVRWREGGRVLRTVRADGTGHFTARGLPRAELDLVAVAERSSSLPHPIDLRDGQGAEDVLLTVENDAMISGLVLGGDLEPVRDAMVFFVHTELDPARITHPGVELTGEDGRFEIVGLVPDDTYVLHVMRPGHFAPVSLSMRGASVRAYAGDDVIIRIPADGGIRGRLVRLDGGAIPRDARVTIGDGGAPRSVGADGAFHLDGVPEGVYELSASAAGFPEVVVGDLRVRAGEVTDAGEIGMRQGRTVSGEVAGADGAPVAGAEVRIALAGADGALVAESDDRGRYTLAIPSDRDAVLHAISGDDGRSEPRALAAGRSPARIDLRFAPHGRVAGTVTRGGAPLRDEIVLLERGIPDGPPLLMEFTDRHGRYELPRVAAGRYRVSLVFTYPTPAPDRFVDREIVVEPGEVTTVDFDTEYDQPDAL